MRALLFVLTMFFTSAALAETVSIVASQDNTIYDDEDGTLSNGSGNHFFAGRTVNDTNRRALLAFKELSAIRSGATLESVKLHVRMNREESPATNVSLLRLNSDWGEGASDAIWPYEGDTALLDVFLSSGMIFDSAEPPITTEQLEGATIEIVWTGCNEGVLKYDIPSLGLSGEIPIERIVLDNVAACEAAQLP